MERLKRLLSKTPQRPQLIRDRRKGGRDWKIPYVPPLAFGRRFGHGPTAYQNKVNALQGALGPASSAFWANTLKTSGPGYSLGAQPLYYAPAQGFYVTSADVPAAQGSVNFSSFGFGRRRRSRKKGSKKGNMGKKASLGKTSKRRSRRQRSRRHRSRRSRR